MELAAFFVGDLRNRLSAIRQHFTGFHKSDLVSRRPADDERSPGQRRCLLQLPEVFGERVNRTWYTLQPGDEVKIVTAAGEPRQVVGQAAPPMELDEFDGEGSTTRTVLAASIAANLRRIADHFDPPPPDLVGTPYIAERLGCTTVWVTEMVRSGEIPPSCVVPGTGNGKPWKFYRERIDRWLTSR